MTEFETFHNNLRIMSSIDMRELVNAGAIGPLDYRAWEAFRGNPWRWFITASDEQAEAVWSIIQARQPKGRAVVHMGVIS